MAAKPETRKGSAPPARATRDREITSTTSTHHNPRGPVGQVLDRLRDVKRTTTGWSARCPAHDDRTASLSISEGDDGRVLIHCHAGCSIESICRALGIEERDLFPRSEPLFDRSWIIRDVDGTEIATHHRIDKPDGKTIWWTRNGSKGLSGLRTSDLPLYGAERLRDFEDGETVIVCEGEKAADAVRAAGLNAVGTVCGAAVTPTPKTLEPLARFDVVLWPDADDAGRSHMAAIARVLNGARLRTVLWTDAPKSGDAADTTADRIRVLVDSAQAYAQQTDEEPEPAPIAGRYTEGGAGDAFADLEWPDLRYCAEWRRWHFWTGTHWKPDTTGEAERRAKDFAVSLYRKAADVDEDAERRRIVAWARKLDTSRATSSVLQWASTDARIALEAAAFDRDVEYLNTPSGSLDLRTFDLRRHRQEDLVTVLCPTPYDPEARAPAWDEHLRHFLPDPDVRRQVQRDLGLALSGANLDEVLSIWYGRGANAKSTTLEVIRRVLGPDYASEAVPNLLIQRKHEAHLAELAALRGKRFVTSSEIAAGAHLDESKVKSLTGGGEQVARGMRQDPFSFPRTWSIVLDCNSRPQIRGTEDAIWRRVRVIPWEVSAIGWEGRRPQADVIAALMDEAPGILRWMVDGLRDWRADPRWIAERVTAATADYRAEEDALGDWIRDCCKVDPLADAPFKDLYASYTEWCEESRQRPLGRDTFGNRLSEQGFEAATGTKKVRIREGIRLLTFNERAKMQEQGEISGGVATVATCPIDRLVSPHGKEKGEVATHATRDTATPQEDGTTGALFSDDSDRMEG